MSGVTNILMTGYGGHTLGLSTTMTGGNSGSPLFLTGFSFYGGFGSLASADLGYGFSIINAHVWSAEPEITFDVLVIGGPFRDPGESFISTIKQGSNATLTVGGTYYYGSYYGDLTGSSTFGRRWTWTVDQTGWNSTAAFVVT